MRIEWNGKKLTKKRALFLCWKLWEWLGESGDCSKWRWPRWEHNGGRVAYMELECPCCEYMRQNRTPEEVASNTDIACRNWCLLWGYWKDGCLSTGASPDSPYDIWDNARDAGKRIKYARRIAAAAKRRYEKL